MKILAKVAYDGSAFYGFARQPNLPSVEGKILEILKSFGVCGELTFAGRTDKGVSASAQFVCFEARHLGEIFVKDRRKLLELLNSKAYGSIKFLNLYGVGDDFHARFCARWREYRYIACKGFVSPFLSRWVGRENFGDFQNLRQILKLFEGEHNFKFFAKGALEVVPDSQKCSQNRPKNRSQNCVRKIMKINCRLVRKFAGFSGEFLIVNVRGNGFLRSQVRLMLGAAFACSRGEIGIEDLRAQIDGKSRAYNIPTSASGLSLKGAGYGI